MKKNNWRNVESRDEGKKAFSMVSFDTNFGKIKNDNEGVDYEVCIFIEGKRGENYSLALGDAGWRTKNIIPILEEQNANIKALSIMMDNDAPLEKQAEMVAEYINKLKTDNHCKKIHVIGISKCGTMSVAMLKYLTDENLNKLNVISCLAPYLGTIYASPKKFFERLDQVVGNKKSKLLQHVVNGLRRVLKPNKEINDRKENVEKRGVAEILKSMYKKIFSDSHMDLDISEGPESINEDQLNRYDESYLKNMFSEKTLDKLRKVSFTNVTTQCTKKTLDNAMLNHNVVAALLYLSSQFIFDEPSDGMVSVRSAFYIEDVCKEKGIKISTLRVPDGHHEVFTDSKMLLQILDNALVKCRMLEAR